MPTQRHPYRGFALRLENGFPSRSAEAIVDRLLDEAGDRVQFVMPRPGSLPTDGSGPTPATPRVFVKGEFRRPHEVLGKRLRASRAVLEGRGLRVLREAGADVPQLLLFGEQSRLRPRAGSILVTEKIRAPNAAGAYKRGDGTACGLRVARALAGLHSLGFVHGDAVLRNFVPVPDRVWIVDLPRWGRANQETIVHDLARLAGSALKLGADAAHANALLDSYIDAATSQASALPTDWRARTMGMATAYFQRVAARDANREERHAKTSRKLRFGERQPD